MRWLLILLVLAGCAGSQVKDPGSVVTTEMDSKGVVLRKTETLTDYAAYLKSFERGGVGTKLVEMDCGTQECSFKGKITVYAPPGGNVAVPSAPVVPEDTGWKVWREVKELAVGVAPWFGVGYAVNKLSGAITKVAQPAPIIPPSNNINVTASGAGASAAAGGSATGSFSNPVTTNTMTGSQNPVSNSHNGGAGAPGGNGGTGGTTGGAGAPGGPGGSGG